MSEIKRIYHHYKKWEDYQNGMYESICFMDEWQLVVDAYSTLSCPEWCYESMTFVALNWRYAAEANLTNTGRNRRAWLGQSACCFVHGCPEYVTKIAWHKLTEKQQVEANGVATDIINHWEDRYLKGSLAWQKEGLELVY